KGGWRKNKAWPYWKQLAKAIDCYQFDIGERVTKTIHTSSLRESLAVLENARLLITTEGGLHHAAAALGVPCITIFTGFTHPAQLGYDDQTNLRADFSPPCGSLSICNHCAEMSAKVSVEEVYEESQRYLVAR
ncbi:MAG: hypothetical protein GWN62_21800, partial [Aliifodinibius sp.]|nr:glycosyltransferase family 9 protein [Phycisphaerae bacterium]NIP52550.1 glycosyltransferase family 9 protein [Phycisphaerae bacterium]NIV13810.1 hypothetical protein [Fodinibius sp.]NIX28163.1 hypothetical protein [Phycisphaerae bacterium]